MRLDLLGQKFGRWTVLESAPTGKDRHTRWLCRCECGIEKVVRTNGLRMGHSTSCGCYHLDEMAGRSPWNKGTNTQTRENLNKNALRWANNNREKRTEQALRSMLWRRFNITLDHYNELAKSQQNKCAICNTEPSVRIDKAGRKINRLCVDHNHQTGKIRGLLCRDCNSALGLFKENKEALYKAVDYLESHDVG